MIQLWKQWDGITKDCFVGAVGAAILGGPFLMWAIFLAYF
jgi:hypothetical protein